MFMRQLPPARKPDKTFEEVVVAAVCAVIARRCAIYKRTSWVEDVGDCLSKQMQERKRDLEKLEKETAGASVPPTSFESTELNTDVGTMVGNGSLSEALGAGRNEVSFSGVGSSEDERKRTITLGAGNVTPQLSAPSDQCKDTEAIRQAVATNNKNENAMVEGADTDFFLIGTLAVDKQQQLLVLPGEERTLGKLFVRMTRKQAQINVGGSSNSFSEEYW